MKIAGIIIAGGRSTRMGGVEKVLLEVGGKRILDRLIGRMAPQVHQLAINANGDGARFKSTGLTVISDLPGGAATPLAGLHAGLHWANLNGYEALVALPSDAPFLPYDLVTKLVSVKQKAAIAASGGQDHYLTGLWSLSLLRSLDDAIKSNGMLRVKDWAGHVGAVAIEWPVHPFDPFFNINTPEDLAEAQAIAAEFNP
ncbi:MAG TPA: molybdenum cofactor guanylyltransferase MobA [Aestuariivirga sp.]|nr:molybdenum cofactor guanylyltransferase MobA [Aestuariivirga sp.]